jgi:hypothetical protein
MGGGNSAQTPKTTTKSSKPSPKPRSRIPLFLTKKRKNTTSSYNNKNDSSSDSLSSDNFSHRSKSGCEFVNFIWNCFFFLKSPKKTFITNKIKLQKYPTAVTPVFSRSHPLAAFRAQTSNTFTMSSTNRACYPYPRSTTVMLFPGIRGPPEPNVEAGKWTVPKGQHPRFRTRRIDRFWA